MINMAIALIQCMIRKGADAADNGRPSTSSARESLLANFNIRVLMLETGSHSHRTGSEGTARAVRPGVWIAAGAWRFRSVATRWKKDDREVPLHVFLRRPTPRVGRAPRWLIEDGRDARAHSALGRRYLTPIECMSKGNF